MWAKCEWGKHFLYAITIIHIEKTNYKNVINRYYPQ